MKHGEKSGFFLNDYISEPRENFEWSPSVGDKVQKKYLKK